MFRSFFVEIPEVSFHKVDSNAAGCNSFFAVLLNFLTSLVDI